MTERVLVTGFEPFDGEYVNPSLEVLKPLSGWRPRGGIHVHTLKLPCVFGDALSVLDEGLHQLKPMLVIGLGQAASRSEISVERVAINVDDARIPDNAGRQPIDQAVVPGGPAAYFSTLPIKAIVTALREAGIPAGVSQTAGTFVCNHVFYGLMHRLAAQHSAARAGFFHLPCLPEQTSAGQGRAMSLETMVRGLRLAVETALSTATDLRVPGGALE
jgi:pyroglutamyl-peptidase